MAKPEYHPSIMNNMVEAKRLIDGIHYLTNTTGGKPAEVAYGILGSADHRLYESDYAYFSLVDFCDATGIDQDELNDAMEEAEDDDSDRA